MSEAKVPKVFISYSWTQEDFVVSLAGQLRSDGVEVILDKWDLNAGQDKYAFMERCVKDEEISKVLVISDKSYAEKANARKGGVGDETVIISGEIYEQMEQQRFIPIVVEKKENGEPYLPIYLKTRIYVDLSNEGTIKEGYRQLLREIFDKPAYEKPPLGKKPEWLDEKNENKVLLTARDMKEKEPQRVDGKFLIELFDNMGTQNGLSWGYSDQDWLSPITKGNVIMVGGKTNSRKSAYVNHIVNWNIKDHKTTYFSMKESAKDVMLGIIAENSILNFVDLKRGLLTKEDWDKVMVSLSEINENSLKIYSAVDSNISCKDVIEIVEKTDSSIVVIDDLNGLLIDNSLFVEEFLYKLKWAAGNSGTIVIIIYNMNIPPNRMDQRPMLEDFPKDCYYRLCDIVHLLYRDYDYYNDEIRFEVIVAKGGKGNGGTINMAAPENINKVVPIAKNTE